MCRPSGRMRRFLLALILLLLLPATATAQEWYQLYDRAVTLVQKGAYIEAEGVLQKAIAAATRAGRGPGPRVFRYGSIREPYFPDFYLGKIYLNTKRAREAVAAFQAAQKQGLPNTPEFQEVTQLIARANDDIARVAANNPGRGPELPGRGATPEPPPVDPRAALQKQFRTLTDTAIQQLKQGNLPEAKRAAQSARDMNFDNPTADNILKDITATETKVAEDKRRNEEANTEKERQGNINNLVGQVDAALKGRDLAKAKTAFNNLNAAAPGDARVADFRTRLDALDREIALAAALTTAERAAMQAFFDKNYDGALKIINAFAQKTGQLSPRGYLYRACSIAALALQSKQPNARDLDNARQQYKQAAQSRNQFQNDLRYISPRILSAIGAS